MRNNYFRDIASLYQEGAVVESKPKKRIFIARTYEDNNDEKDTFIKEAQAAGQLSAAEGIPFEIITVKSEKDWQNKVEPLVKKSKGKGVQWGVFGHTTSYGADIETVDDIMSNADEVFLGSCSGFYCAQALPKTREQSRLITNSGATWTGVPRFKDYKSQIEQVKKSNPNESPFLSLMYGNMPDYRYGGPGKLDADYIDWKNFNLEKLTDEDRNRLVRLRALSELRHNAYERGEERPIQLPADYVISDYERLRILDDLGLLSPEEQDTLFNQRRLDQVNMINSTFNRDVPFEDLIEIFADSYPNQNRSSNPFSSVFVSRYPNEGNSSIPFTSRNLERLESNLENLSENDFIYEYGVPVDVARRFIDKARSTLAERERYSDSINTIPSRGQIESTNMYLNAMRPPQLSGVQNRKIGGIVLRK